MTDAELFEIAQTRVRARYAPEFAPVLVARYTQPDGFYFGVNVKTIGGNHGFFVHRATGEIWEFGSGYTVPDDAAFWFAFYGAGWKPQTYRVTFHTLPDPLWASALILTLKLGYTVLQEENGVVWQNYKKYTFEVLQARFQTLPCAFLVWGVELYRYLPELAKQTGLEFTISVPPPRQPFSWDPAHYRPEQLGPQWDN